MPSRMHAYTNLYTLCAALISRAETIIHLAQSITLYHNDRLFNYNLYEAAPGICTWNGQKWKYVQHFAQQIVDRTRP